LFIAVYSVASVASPALVSESPVYAKSEPDRLALRQGPGGVEAGAPELEADTHIALQLSDVIAPQPSRAGVAEQHEGRPVEPQPIIQIEEIPSPPMM
jgi:hypothetical protein